MTTRRAGGHRWSAAALASLVGALSLVGIVAGSTPAGAEITAVNPAFREVDPGGSTTAGVTVTAGGLTCISASASRADLAPTLSPECSDAGRWSSVLTVQVPEEPGTYSVRIRDDNFGGREGTFTLRVRPPPTTTTAPPTTTSTTPPSTTPPPTTATTTAPAATSTTVAPTTTTPATDATTTTSTTATTSPPVTEAFTPLAELVEVPVPSEGVYFPLLGDGYRNCLPLTAACGDPGSGLVLIPARATEIEWGPIPEGSTSPPRTDLRGVAALSAVGVGPAEPRAQNYALSILDLTAPGGQLRTLIRGMGDDGRLGVVTADLPLVRPTFTGSSVDLGDTASVAAMPFGRPSIRTASSFSEAAPALPVFVSAEPQLIYAFRPDNAWGLNFDLVPFFDASVPFLVRGIEGPPGLYLSRPENLRVPQAADTESTVPASANGGDGGGGTPTVVVLGLVVALGAVVTAALTLLRRGRNAPTA